ncbi:hypothetical protein BD413DRAFT_611989 [Trametes elegans]|nr:hypothetical protein BD413DRAFT_611989 [Trametes elegans]
MASTVALLSHIGNWNPSTILPIAMILGADVLRRAQSVPAGIAPLSIGWPEFLLSIVASRRLTLASELPCTVINAKSGYARTNRSVALEHLLRSHAAARPAKGGLTITFLYTSTTPGTPTPDAVSYSAAATTIGQLLVASVLPTLGVGSSHVFAITASGAVLSTAAALLLRSHQKHELRHARPVPPGRRDVVCITCGNGSAEAVVVVAEGGGVRVEDLAASRAGGLGAVAAFGAGVLLALWLVLLLALTTLDRADAWGVLALCGIGTAHTTYAARKWRSGAAIGFKFSEEATKVVRDDKVMEALKKAEEAETGVGSALLPVFFPGRLRPEENLWWAERKRAPQGF